MPFLEMEDNLATIGDANSFKTITSTYVPGTTKHKHPKGYKLLGYFYTGRSPLIGRSANF